MSNAGMSEERKQRAQMRKAFNDRLPAQKALYRAMIARAARLADEIHREELARAAAEESAPYGKAVPE